MSLEKLIRLGSAAGLVISGISMGWMGHDVAGQEDQQLQRIESSIESLEQEQERSVELSENLSDRFKEIQEARNRPQAISVVAETGYYGSPVLDAPDRNLTVDSITFSFEKDLKHEGELVYGLAYPESDLIELNTRQKPVKFYESCTHEVVGHLRSGYAHTDDVIDYSNGNDWIERYEDSIVSPTCLKLLYKLDGGGENA